MPLKISSIFFAISLAIATVLTGSVPGQEAPVTIVASLDKRIITTRDLDFYAVEKQIREPSARLIPLEKLHRDVIENALADVLIGDWALQQIDSLDSQAIEDSVLSTLANYESMMGGRKRFIDLLGDADFTKEEFSQWLRGITGKRIPASYWLQLQVPMSIPEQGDVTVAEGVRVRLLQLQLDLRNQEKPQEYVMKLQHDLAADLRFDDALRLYDPNGLHDPGWLEIKSMDGNLLDAIGHLRVNQRSDVYYPIRSIAMIFQITEIDTEERIAFRRAVEAQEQEELRMIYSMTDARIHPSYMTRKIRDLMGDDQ